MKPLLLVPAAALLALGGDGLYHALRSRDRVAIDCADFARARPSSHRVLVTGCELDYAGAGYRESNGKIEELLLPARPAGRGAPAPLVIATRHPSALALVQSVLGGGKTASPQESVATMESAASAAGTAGPIDGLIRSGAIERIRTRRVLSGLPRSAVSPDAAIVDLNRRATFVQPVLALAAGLLLGMVALLPSATKRGASWSREGTAAPHDPIAGHERPHRSSAHGSTVTLPRLLLLALDVTAGPDAVEEAPPLGSRRDVIARLHAIIPDAHADVAHRRLSRGDESITVDLGAADPIVTAIVDARGEAGVALVKEILLMTGWRAFAPSTGLFVTIDDLNALAALAAEDRQKADAARA